MTARRPAPRPRNCQGPGGAPLALYAGKELGRGSFWTVFRIGPAPVTARPLQALLACLLASLMGQPASGQQGPAAAAAPLPRVEAPRWPAQLRKRNARYAVLDRVEDRAGDEREAVWARASLSRVTDRCGDREEVRRERAFRNGHFGTIHAHVARAVDRHGDRVQLALAAATRARQHAALARVRYPRASAEQQVRYGVRFDDEVELAEYKENYLQYGPAAEQVEIANQEDDPLARDYIAEREDDRDATEAEHQADREGGLLEDREAGAERDERNLGRGDGEDDEAERHDDLDDDLDLERLEEADDGEVERGLEDETERTLQTEEASSL